MVNATLAMAIILAAALGAAEGAPRERAPPAAKTAEEATSTALDRAAPIAARSDRGSPTTEASPDCSATLPLLEAWARKQEIGGSSVFVECAGHPRVLSVGDGRLLAPDEAKRSCAASWCFWVRYEARSGSELRRSLHPPRDRAGRYWEHVNRVSFRREPTGSWVLEVDPSITITDGYQLPSETR